MSLLVVHIKGKRFVVNASQNGGHENLFELFIGADITHGSSDIVESLLLGDEKHLDVMWKQFDGYFAWSCGLYINLITGVSIKTIGISIRLARAIGCVCYPGVTTVKRVII